MVIDNEAATASTTAAAPTQPLLRRLASPLLGLLVVVAELAGMWALHSQAVDARAASEVAAHLAARLDELDVLSTSSAARDDIPALRAATARAVTLLDELADLGVPAAALDAAGDALRMHDERLRARDAVAAAGRSARTVAAARARASISASHAAAGELGNRTETRAVRADLVARIGFTAVMLLAILLWTLLFRRFVRERQQAEYLAGERQALQRSEERFRSLIHNASDLVALLDADTTIRYQTLSSQRLLGRDPSELIGTRLLDLVHPDDAPAALAFLEDAFAQTGVSQRAQWRLQRAAGGWLPVEALATNLCADPNIGGVVLTMRDVRERQVLQDRLAQQALHDPLTGLANRALFSDRLRHADARRARTGDYGLAVCFLDLDGFKDVNDAFGPAVGDEVLAVVAARLSLHLREGDTAARFGGDEFAVLLEDVADPAVALDVGARLAMTLRDPIEVSGGTVSVRASIGIAVAGPEVSGAEELMRCADVAMYTAKRDGQGQCELYRPEMHAALVERLALKADLQRAVERGEFEVHYQPTIVLATGAIAGVEALVRWRHPERGLVPPLDFVPLAEETGLIAPIGRWVLEQSCRQLLTWQRRHPSATPLTMSVNLSPRQLAEPGIVDEVADVLGRTGVDPATLVLEITESALLDRTEQMIGRLSALKALGLRLAIDDFGTGYSSLSYLHGLPIDILKIDKSFVDGVDGDGESAALTSMIIDLARTLRLQTVAEGVELAGQAGRLRELDCRLGQGYYWAKPLPADAVDRFLAGQRRRPVTPPRERRAPNGA